VQDDLKAVSVRKTENKRCIAWQRMPSYMCRSLRFTARRHDGAVYAVASVSVRPSVCHTPRSSTTKGIISHHAINGEKNDTASDGLPSCRGKHVRSIDGLLLRLVRRPAALDLPDYLRTSESGTGSFKFLLRTYLFARH